MFACFLGIRWWWSGVHCLRCFLQCVGPINFQMSSADISDVAKFQVGQLCSRGFERIIPNRGVDCGFRWMVPFHTEKTLFSVDCAKFYVYFHSSSFDRMHC